MLKKEKNVEPTSKRGNDAKPNVSGSYFYDKMMEHINNPKPLQKPPYSCPRVFNNNKNECGYPNCLCYWQL